MKDSVMFPDVLWESIRSLGYRRSAVIREAQVSLTAMRSNAQLPTSDFFALWDALSNLSDDPAIGLQVALSLRGAAMPPSFMVAYHARDFRDALQCVSRFKRLCSPEDIILEESGERCEIRLHWDYSGGQAVPTSLVDLTFATLMELGQQGAETQLSAHSVELMRPKNEKLKTHYEQYFGCIVRFDAGRDCLTLNRRDLNKTFVNYNVGLLDILAPELDKRLLQQTQSESIRESVRWVLRHRLATGRPDIRSVAAELAMSQRSLQRKLSETGLTFQKLLSELRHELALEYLSDPALGIIEIAFMLGYEDQNSFFRTFRQWEKLSPTAWREIHDLNKA